MLWLIYVVGILIAVVSAKLLRVTVFKGESSPFLMELPPYKLPTMKRAFFEMWERGRLFLRKAGTMILGVTIVLWALSSFPELDPASQSALEFGDENAAAAAQMEHSIAGRIGHAIEPVIAPMGFDWRIGTALIGAFAAKEVFVAQMGIVYSVGEANETSDTLRSRLRRDYGPLVAFCIMLFALISSPCLATVAVTRRESNSWWWAAFQFWGLTAVAYLVTVIVYQVGSRISGIV
jgi:ferrous iron transport protein B